MPLLNIRWNSNLKSIQLLVLICFPIIIWSWLASVKLEKGNWAIICFKKVRQDKTPIFGNIIEINNSKHYSKQWDPMLLTDTIGCYYSFEVKLSSTASCNKHNTGWVKLHTAKKKCTKPTLTMKPQSRLISQDAYSSKITLTGRDYDITIICQTLISKATYNKSIQLPSE